MLEAISGIYPNLTIDFPRVVVSKGELLGLENANVIPQAGAVLKFTWNDNSGQGEAQTTDNLFLVVYSEQKNTSLFRVEAAARTSTSFTYTLPTTWTGDTVHCWISVASADNKKYGNSEYFGPLVVV